MKIIAMSDNHGMLLNPRKILTMHPDADLIVHCGDSQETIEELKRDFPSFRYITVRGNCDFDFSLPNYEIFTAEGIRCMATHGHLYNVKFGLDRLMYAAEENEIRIVFFGHTHSPYNEYFDGIYYINPGAVSGYRGSFAVVEIKDGQVLSNIAYLDQKKR